MAISISQAFAQWQELTADFSERDKADRVLMSESWNDYTDSLYKDGELGALQYHYCPAYDDVMPDEGSRFDALSGDREFILDAMNVDIAAVFVPFSQSRNKNEKLPTLNWRITLRKDSRNVITTDYMQGCTHCPAYSLSIAKAGGKNSIMRDEMIRRECETGKVAKTADSMPSGRAIDPPSVADIMCSLLIDASAIDSHFYDWCVDFGMNDDSIKAHAMYDACLKTALALRRAFGDKTLADLRELFEDM